MSKYRLIMFDMDETLIEIPNAYSFFDGIIVETLSRLGFKSTPPQEERDLIWRAAKESVVGLKAWGITDPRSFWSTFDKIDFERRKALIKDGAIKPYHDTIPSLKKLRSDDIKISIITNTIPEIAEYTLNHFNMTSLFDYVLALGDDQESCKPEPHGIFKTLDHFGVDKHEAAIVGDSSADMTAGMEAGVDCYRVLRDPGRIARLDLSQVKYTLITDLESLFKYL